MQTPSDNSMNEKYQGIDWQRVLEKLFSIECSILRQIDHAMETVITYFGTGSGMAEYMNTIF